MEKLLLITFVCLGCFIVAIHTSSLADKICTKSVTGHRIVYNTTAYRCVKNNTYQKYSVCHDHGWWNTRCHIHTHYRQLRVYGICYRTIPSMIVPYTWNFTTCCDGWKGSRCEIDSLAATSTSTREETTSILEDQKTIKEILPEVTQDGMGKTTTTTDVD